MEKTSEASRRLEDRIRSLADTYMSDSRGREALALDIAVLLRQEVHEKCHDLSHLVPRHEFEAGCKAYQDQLYGPKPKFWMISTAWATHGRPEVETTRPCLYTQVKTCKEIDSDRERWCNFCRHSDIMG